MKTPEDEEFEAIERRQGGFQAKRAMAADKLRKPVTKDETLRIALEALEDINKLSVGENAICLPAEIDTAMDAIKEALAQPEPIQVTIKDFVAVVEGKEDWVGKPVYWAQWPNKETL